MITKEKPEQGGEISEIETLLPWFAAGTLSRKDSARVEQALANDPELARRFEMVREELGETIRLNEMLGAPSTRAMNTLFEKIDAEPARAQAPSLGLMARLSSFVAELSPRAITLAGAAAALAIVLQAGVITGVMLQDRAPAGGPQLASAPSTSQGVFADIRFAPQATAADVTKFLQDNKLTIVSGPAAGTGFYRVAMAGIPKAELANAVRRLQGDRSVSFVAPVQ